MKTSKLILLLLLLILSSCNKDENYIESDIVNEHDHQHQEYALSHKSLSMNSYLSDIPEDEIERSDMEVPTELLVDIKNALVNLENYMEWSNAIQINGDIRWNWSLLNVNIENDYYVILPIFENTRMTAMLRYIHIEDHFHFELVTLNEIREITNNYSDIPQEEKYVNYLSIFQRLQLLSDGLIYEKANRLIEDYITNLPKDRIIPKNYSFTSVTTIQYWTWTAELVETDDGPEERVTYTSHSESIFNTETIPCSGGGGGGSPGVGGNNTSEPEEEEEEEVELEKEIMITDEECKKQKMTGKAAEFLENELLNMTFPCSELDHQGILDEIVQECGGGVGGV